MMSPQSKSLSYANLKRVIDRRSRKKLAVFSLLRILANALDIIGVATVALLASAFGAFAGSEGPSSLQIPFFGNQELNENFAIGLAFVVALVFVTKSIFSVFLNLKSSTFVAELESSLAQRLAEGYFLTRRKSNAKASSLSEFQNVAIASVGGIRGFLNGRILFLSEGSLLISLLLVFAVVSPISTLGLVTLMSAVLFFLNRFIGRKIAFNGRKQIDSSKEALESAKDLFGIKREVQARGAMDVWLGKFSDARARLSQANAMIYTLSSLPRYVIETSLIVAVFMFLGGVILFSDIQTQAVAIGVFLAGGLRLVASVVPFQGAISAMKNGAATGHLALEELLALTDKIEVRQSHLGVADGQSLGLEFQDVRFKYQDSTIESLANVSFSVRPSTKVALVGPSGAGKSTVFDLAMGFLVPDEGDVLIDGKSARDVLLDSKQSVALVPQRPHLISGDLVENVSLLPHQETDTLKVKKVLRRVGLETLVNNDKWLSREVRPDSGSLSGGEIQRLSLARALYQSPKILFLDEPTSGLDAATELDITNLLDELKEEMTVVLIAHRLSTLKKADKIIYLNKGKVLAEGNYEDLKSKVPDFARAIEILDTQT